MPEPFVRQDEESIGAVPLADSNQGTTQNIPISGYMVTATWLKKYPNTAAAFRTAIIKAQAIAATDPGAVEQGMERYAARRRKRRRSRTRRSSRPSRTRSCSSGWPT